MIEKCTVLMNKLSSSSYPCFIYFGEKKNIFAITSLIWIHILKSFFFIKLFCRDMVERNLIDKVMKCIIEETCFSILKKDSETF